MKLNLGSGYSGNDALFVVTQTTSNPDWKHVDVCSLYAEAAGPNFECYDFTEGIREADNSVEGIWMGDVLEHVYKFKTRDLLRDCFRVMVPGGEILISVPDMSIAMNRWLGSDCQDESCADLIFGQQDARDRKNCGPDSHHFGFSFGSLAKLLTETGFTDLRRLSLHGNWFELTISARKPLTGVPAPATAMPAPEAMAVQHDTTLERYTNSLYEPNPTILVARWHIPGYPLIVGGSIVDAADWAHLASDFGVTHCVNVETEHGDEGKLPAEQLCERRVVDDGQPLPTEAIRDICSFVKSSLAANPAARFYVHCQMGGSRSPAFAYAILRGAFGLNQTAALIALNSGFPHALQNYYGYHGAHQVYIASVEAALEGWTA